MPGITTVVVWNHEGVTDQFRKSCTKGTEISQVVSWAEFKALGKTQTERSLDARIAAQKPGHCCALIYTSGTTGRPKGAVHTQQQLLYPSAAAIATEGLDEDARIGTPLPLSTLNILLLGPLTALACGGVAV